MFAITPKLMNTFLLKNFLREYGQKKEELIKVWEGYRSYSEYKKNPEFSLVPFLMILSLFLRLLKKKKNK